MSSQLFNDLKDIKAIFITGTDTGVGKSILSAVLALNLFFNYKKNVAISKPIQTGNIKDTDFLEDITGKNIRIFNTYSLFLGAAPSVASKIEKKEIEIKKIINDIKTLENSFDSLIVEGIGGTSVPIINNESTKYIVSDLIKELNYPVVVVCRPSLGTINHSILTIEHLKQKGVNLLGYVISGYDTNSTDPVIKTASEEITNITNVKCLWKLPVIESPSFEELFKLLEKEKTLNSVSW